jgi:hypothetical protein
MPRAAFPSGRKSLLLIAFLAILIGGAWWWQRPPPEPVYNGERLSEWLRAPNAKRVPTEIRLRQLQSFGPAAVRWLTYTIEHGRRPFQKRGPLPFEHAPDWLRRKLPDRWGGLRTGVREDERKLAINALMFLGPDGVPAIPALQRSLQSDDDELVRGAAFALQAIGSASWPIITDALEHGKQPVRTALLGTMGWRLVANEGQATGTEVEHTVDAIVNASRDSDAVVRAAAAAALGECRRYRKDHSVSDPSLPALVRLLSDSDPAVQTPAMGSLSCFGTEAAPAIPRLMEFLDAPDPGTRGNSAKVLSHIDGEMKHSATRLRAMIHDRNVFCREEAANALKALGLSTPEESATANSVLTR